MELGSKEKYETPFQTTKRKQKGVSYLIWIALTILIIYIIGIIGFKITENMSWIDAVYTVSSRIGGSGTTKDPQTTAGKLFASIYAIVTGLGIFIVLAVIIRQVASDLRE